MTLTARDQNPAGAAGAPRQAPFEARIEPGPASAGSATYPIGLCNQNAVTDLGGLTLNWRSYGVDVSEWRDAMKPDDED
jgi:hypothetical protein